jgi:hypothetical protein
MSAELEAQPPSAAPSATIPRIRISLIPQTAVIQAQLQVEGNSENAQAAREGLEFYIPARTYFAARPASHERPPTTAKITAAIQASEAEWLLMLITKTTIAAISHREAIARPHQ